MNVTAVASSTLAAVGYESAVRILHLEFCSGELYRYLDVPEELYEGLLRASSKGQYFNERIRDRFPYGRVARAEGA